MDTLSSNAINASNLHPKSGAASPTPIHHGDHAVAWNAIFAGATAAAALSLILLILGTGLGLSSVSPWARDGLSAGALGVSAIVWLGVTQILASGMGGYIAGRLGAKWADVHADEAYFRDTAHGLLAWSVASLGTAALLTSVIGSIVGTGVSAVGATAGSATLVAAASIKAGVPASNGNNSPTSADERAVSYVVDTLFRKDVGTVSTPAVAASNVDSERPLPSAAGESARILANAIQNGALVPDDARYLGQVISQRTGISQIDAEKRVTTAYARLQAKMADAEVAAREAADKARKVSANTALWLFISLLIGAFCASFAATLGGRQRRS